MPLLAEVDHDKTELVRSAFRTAYRLRTEGKFTGTTSSNSRRSAKFVYEVAERLRELEGLRSDQIDVQRVDERGDKKPGEWLLDIAIAKRIEICDPGRPNDRPVSMRASLQWAVESEFAVSLESFAEDFGKLLCVNAKNRMYLNGMNQDSEKTRSSYVNRRLETVRAALDGSATSGKNFWMGFWPSPEKKGLVDSLWDDPSYGDLTEQVVVYRLPA